MNDETRAGIPVMTNTDVVDRGVDRLNDLLPLTARHASLDADAAAVHREILGGFLRTGAAPDEEHLRRLLPATDVASARSRLADADLVVVADERVVGAYPFRSDSDDPEVVVDGVRTGAMCSLDALAIGVVTERDTKIRSRCPVTGREISIEMSGGLVVSADPPSPTIGIRWQDPGSCAAATLCRDMVFLADEDAAREWADGTDAGLYTLPDAVEFADRFFRPVMSPALDVR